MGGSRPCNETCHWAASVGDAGKEACAVRTARGVRNRVLFLFTHTAFIPLIDCSTQWASASARSILYALIICPLVQGSSGQTATLTTHRLIRLSYLSLVSVRIPLRVLPTNSTSDVFRSYRGRFHDCHHDDLTHPGWTKGDPHVPLELYGH